VRKTIKQSVAIFAAVLLASAMPAVAADGSQPKSAAATRPAYTTQAPIVMLKDLDSGEILFSRGAEKRFAPASMAKVMTAYVVLDLIKKGELTRDKQFTVSEATWKKWRGSNGGSTMFLRPGEKVSADDLLKGLITVSGNDAAAALAVGIDGSEEAFVKRMNAVAAKIGMASSNFGTPNGWPDGGVTKVSAADLITLADRLIRDHPAGYTRYFSLPRLQHGISPEGKPIIQANRNPILGRVLGADGLKTGHTSEAGYCLLGSAKRDGRRLIMVVAGLPSDKARRDEAERLMTWGFAISMATNESGKGKKIASGGARAAP
jgi:D-alanyl-D-alanine carboxypeptidase (penicillin-binding protein 5/6)